MNGARQGYDLPIPESLRKKGSKPDGTDAGKSIARHSSTASEPSDRATVGGHERNLNEEHNAAFKSSYNNAIGKGEQRSNQQVTRDGKIVQGVLKNG